MDPGPRAPRILMISVRYLCNYNSIIPGNKPSPSHVGPGATNQLTLLFIKLSESAYCLLLLFPNRSVSLSISIRHEYRFEV